METEDVNIKAFLQLSMKTRLEDKVLFLYHE